MDKTQEIMAALSSKPCSVIVIGVGDEDYDNMRKLDGDGPDKLPGAERDIVQFVAFNEALKKGDLAEQVLKEIPAQFMGFMKKHNIPVAHTQQDMSQFDK